LPRQRVIRNGQIDRFQPLDLIAQAGGLFELKVFGGFAHFVTQTRQMGLKIGAMHRFVDLGGDPGLISVALVESGQHILDVLG